MAAETKSQSQPLRIVVVDNYDSFTYNLVQYLAELGGEVTVVRNDQVQVSDVVNDAFDGIMVSPGPGAPKDAGISKAVIRQALDTGKPLIGVCLGHQAIIEELGGEIISAGCIMHGKTSEISHDGLGVFQGIPSPYTVVRYHSLAGRRDVMPKDLVVSATSEDGEIMGIRHVGGLLEGVQFHPESIGSSYGYELLRNWLDTVERARSGGKGEG